MYGLNEMRPEGEWALAIFPQTWCVRLFRTERDLLMWYDRSERKPRDRHMFYSFKELTDIYSPVQLQMFIEQLTAPREEYIQTFDARDKVPHCQLPAFTPTKDKLELAKHLWSICQIVGERVTGETEASRKRRPFFEYDLDRMKSGHGSMVWSYYPRQAKMLIQFLVKENIKQLYYDDVGEFMAKMVQEGFLKTKQDPERIFHYYMPKLADDSFAKYPTKKNGPVEPQIDEASIVTT